MSKRKSPQAPLELPLFDLPLNAADEAEDDPAEDLGEELEDAGDLPLEQGPSRPSANTRQADRAGDDGGSEPAEEPPAPLRDRLLAGLLDLGIQLLVVSGSVAAVHAMGIPPSLDDWLPFTLLGLIFSFLYWFIPLAFWGQTPGMAWVGNSALALSDEPLTFGQSALRWLGALVTLGLLGVPLLFALGGRSLTDRLSESKTVVLQGG